MGDAPVDDLVHPAGQQLGGRALTEEVQCPPQGRAHLVLCQRRRVILFGELVAVGLHRQRQMHPGGHRCPQGLVEGNLAHRRLQQVGTAHYLGDAAVHIVHHHRQVVGVEPIAPAHDEILLGQRRRYRDTTLQAILEVVDRVMLAQAGGAALCTQSEGAAVAVVKTAARHDFAPGTAAPVEIAGPVELLDDFVVAGVTPALVHHLAIPLQAMGLKGLEDKVGGPSHLPRRIDIFDAHQPAPLLCPGLQEAAERRNQGAEVERTRRGGGKAAYIREGRG